MVDWNGNGKQDMTDSFIDYQTYSQDAEDAGGDKPSGLLWILLALGIAVFFFIRL